VLYRLLNVLRPYGALLPLPLRVIARRNDEAIQNLHKPRLLLRVQKNGKNGIWFNFLKIRVKQKILSRFFAERLAEWEKGCIFAA